MSCGNSEDRFVNQQEHRNINRIWEKTITKQNPPQEEEDLNRTFVVEKKEDDSDQPDSSICEKITLDPCEAQLLKKRFNSESFKKKLAKGKTIPKRKSPLQKFDEIVSRELNNYRMTEECGVVPLEPNANWSRLTYSGSRVLGFGQKKITVDNKVSRGALHSVEKDTKDEDPSDVENAALMEAIEKLAQAQAYCRFEAAVKAAEEATASVPPEKAEEVAVALAKDYQAEIVDVINEQMPSIDEKKPIEVIGYIGMTKLKNTV